MLRRGRESLRLTPASFLSIRPGQLDSNLRTRLRSNLVSRTTEQVTALGGAHPAGGVHR
jgi:hypothetical protein